MKSKLFYLPEHKAEDGNLIVFEDSVNAFRIRRTYFVYGVPNRAERGGHAHKKTNQIIICLQGKIECICREHNEEERFILDSPTKALFIPKMVWDSQIYEDPNSIMLAHADTLYDPNDYIMDYEEFLSLV